MKATHSGHFVFTPFFLAKREAHEKSINFHKNPDSSEQQNAN
jgi:hypothetical protein